MNEERKKYNDFMNPSTTKAQQQASDLLAAVVSFAKFKNELSLDDAITINNMIKQLSNKKAIFPHKVLRGIQNKFISIQQQYMRQKNVCSK
nr:hypothetical protein [Candidatus Enterousia merdequi]